jgi:hypothetical protein
MVSAAVPAPYPPQASPPQHTEDQLRALTGNAFRLKLIVDRLGGHFLGVNAIAHQEFAHVIYAFARFATSAVGASLGIPRARSPPAPLLVRVYVVRRRRTDFSWVALCRGVDFALSVGDVPVMTKEIPGILRKVMPIVLTFRELMRSTVLGNHTRFVACFIGSMKQVW